MIYLSDADVESLGLSYRALAEAIERAFSKRRESSRPQPAKGVLTPGRAATFFAMPAMLDENVGMKWLAYGRDNRAAGLPSHTGVVIVNDPDTGAPKAIISASHLTAMRTAATTLIAARRLARRDRIVVGLAGYGAQALAHLRALGEIATIDRVMVLAHGSRTRIDDFFRTADPADAACAIVNDPEELVSSSDIVVSTLPPGVAPMLDAAAMRDGAFAAMVDLGRSWRPEGIAALDAIFTDDAAALRKRAATEPHLAALPIAGEIGAALTAPAGARTALLAPGSGLADVAAAALVLEAAKKAGVGVSLRL